MHAKVMLCKGRKKIVFQEKVKDRDGKYHAKTIKDLGFLDDLEKIYPDALAHFKEEAKTLTSKRAPEIIEMSVNKFGLMPFDNNGKYNITLRQGDVPISRIIRKLGLDTLLDSKRRRRNFDFNLTNLARLLIYERILDPGSKISDWRNRDHYYGNMEFTQSQIYSGLIALGEWKESIIENLNEKMKKLYGRRSGFGFFDGTNIYYEIEDEDGFRMRGVSKEHRPLPITQLGVLLDSKGIPMSYDMYSGNTNDVTMLKPAMERARERFGLKHMIYVADKGFYSGDNIASAICNHEGYIISNSIKGTKVSETLRKAVISMDGYRFFNEDGTETKEFDAAKTCFMYKCLNNIDGISVSNEEGIKHRVNGVGKYCICYWSRKYSERAKIERAKALEKAYARDGSKSESKINNNYGSNKYLKTEIKTRTGEKVEEYKASVRFDSEALDRDESTDGFYLIETNLAGKDWFDDQKPFKEGEESRWREDWGMLQLNTELTVFDIIGYYRNLWMIEDSFRILKSFFSLRPAFVWTKESLEGHFLICFMALLIIKLIYFKLNEEFTIPEIIESLREAEIAEVEPGKYITLRYNRVLMRISNVMNLALNQKAYTQDDLKKLHGSAKKV